VAKHWHEAEWYEIDTTRDLIMHNRWTYWAVFNLLHQSLEDPGMIQHREVELKNDPILGYPIPGGALDFSDPALRAFLRICGIQQIDAQTELYDVIRGVSNWNNLEFRKAGFGGYECSNFESLFANQHRGAGWEEVDRLVYALCHSSLTDLAAISRGWLTFSDTEPFHGSDSPIVVEIHTKAMFCQMGEHRDYLLGKAGIIASNYEHALLAINQKMLEMNSRATKTEMPEESPMYITITDGQKSLCSVMVSTSLIGERYHGDVLWSGVSWTNHDQKLLEAMLKVLPKDLHNKIQGDCFSSELGI